MKCRSWFKFASHYAWGTNRVCDCKMDVKSTWNPTWHQMDHVSWSLGLFQKPPLGGRLNTKPRDHGTPDAHESQPLVYSIKCENPHDQKPIEITFGRGSGRIWLHTTLEGLWPQVHDFGVCWDGLWTLSCGLSQFHGYSSWLVCEVALSCNQKDPMQIL